MLFQCNELLGPVFEKRGELIAPSFSPLETTDEHDSVVCSLSCLSLYKLTQRFHYRITPEARKTLKSRKDASPPELLLLFHSFCFYFSLTFRPSSAQQLPLFPTALLEREHFLAGNFLLLQNKSHICWSGGRGS